MQTVIRLSIALLIIASPIFSQIQEMPICTSTGIQDYPAIATDGFGNAIMVWHDRRHGDSSNNDLYAQKLNLSGEPLWELNGVPVCTEPSNQGGQIGGEGSVLSGLAPARIIGDGNGGAIVAWRDDRNSESAASGDIYVQKIYSNGQIAWAPAGIPICTAINEQSQIQLISDGVGGAIITWEDFRNGGDIYAQRIDANGNVLWQQDGIIVCNAQYSQRGPQIITDTAGGAIIVWTDLRSPTLPPHYDIYAQRISPEGIPMWSFNGVSVCRAPGSQYIYHLHDAPTVVSDGFGGAIIAWYDERAGGFGQEDIYAQRINSEGIIQWQTNGNPVCTFSNQQIYPALVPDGTGGVYITWRDQRVGGFEFRNYIQRLDSTGAIQWTQDGEIISDTQSGVSIVWETPNGVSVLWQDFRNENANAYIQTYNSNGTSGGQIFIDSPGSESRHQTVHITEGNYITVWQDSREGGDENIYAAVGGGDVSTGQPIAIPDFFVSSGTEPNFFPLLRNDIIPAGTEVEIVITSPPSIGQIVSIDSDGVWFRGDGDFQDGFSYALQLTNTNEAGIEKTTLSRSGDVSLLSLFFCFCPITFSQCPYLNGSLPYREDNKNPQIASQDTIDFDLFYRARDELLTSTSIGAEIIEAYYSNTPEILGLLYKRPDLLSEARQTFLMIQEPLRNLLEGDGTATITQSLVDAIENFVSNLGGSGTPELRGILEAQLAQLGTLDNYVGQPVGDVTESALGSTTSVKEKDDINPIGFHLAQNYPNPFNPATVIRYTVPENHRVNVSVFNVLGRKIATLINKNHEPGNYAVSFTANDLPTGVYFVRLKAGNQIQIRKMLLVR